MIKKILDIAARYFDDLLLIASGICFTLAASIAFGKAAAFAVAGACLGVYAYAVAKAKGGK